METGSAGVDPARKALPPLIDLSLCYYQLLVTVDTHNELPGDLMADQDSDRKNQPSVNPPKKIYQPPSFRFERVFETSALSCGKISATQVTCHFNRKSS